MLLLSFYRNFTVLGEIKSNPVRLRIYKKLIFMMDIVLAKIPVKAY